MLIFYEKKYAEKLLRHGFTQFMSQKDLNILARYYKSIGKNSRQIREDLIDFCKKHNPGFNEFLFEKNLKYAIESSKKHALKGDKDIFITSVELDAIRSMPDHKQQRILFVMIAIAKFYHKDTSNGYYVNAKFPQLVKLAGLNLDRKERNALLFSINSAGMIETNLLGGYKILFVDENQFDVAVRIADMDKVIEYFPFFCEKCGKRMDKKLPRHNMCRECYTEKRKEDKRKWWNDAH